MEAQSTNGAAPDVVLIHGLWMTRRSGEHWKEPNKEFAGRPHIPRAPGRQGVADLALDWAANPVAHL